MSSSEETQPLLSPVLPPLLFSNNHSLFSSLDGILAGWSQIVTSSDLNCNFNDLCRWRNLTGSTEEDGRFMLTDNVHIDKYHHIRPIQNATGNRFAYTQGSFDGYHRAALVSDIISCQIGGGSLQLWYYRTGIMTTLDACIRQPPGSSDPTALKCFPAFANSHGQQWTFSAIEFPPVTQPFEVTCKIIIFLLLKCWMAPRIWCAAFTRNYRIRLDQLSCASVKGTGTGSVCAVCQAELSAKLAGFYDEEYFSKKPHANRQRDWKSSMIGNEFIGHLSTQKQERLKRNAAESSITSPSPNDYEDLARLLKNWYGIDNTRDPVAKTSLAAEENRQNKFVVSDQNTVPSNDGVVKEESPYSVLLSALRQLSPTTMVPSQLHTILPSPIIPYMVVDPLSSSIAPQTQPTTPTIGSALHPNILRDPQKVDDEHLSKITEAFDHYLPNVTQIIQQFAPVLSRFISAMRSKTMDITRQSDTATSIDDLSQQSFLSNAPNSQRLRIHSTKTFQKSPIFISSSSDRSDTAVDITSQDSDSEEAVMPSNEALQVDSSNQNKRHNSLSIKRIPKNNFGMQRTMRRFTPSSFSTTLAPATVNISGNMNLDIIEQLEPVTLKTRQQAHLSHVQPQTTLSSRPNEPATIPDQNADIVKQTRLEFMRNESVEVRGLKQSQPTQTHIGSEVEKHGIQSSILPLTVFERKHKNQQNHILKSLPDEVLKELKMLRKIPNIDELTADMDLNLMNQPGGFNQLKEQFIERFLQWNNISLSPSSRDDDTVTFSNFGRS
ncbi:unnamed protein product [Anisakis simplex]|uniref:MAM domain-containing protein n=1 Tax=Anisakis simplex TaxID=6269 RepID=A0A0M3JR69_ANISI|nr:unnamed protein product [Anisakis simplex]